MHIKISFRLGIWMQYHVYEVGHNCGFLISCKICAFLLIFMKQWIRCAKYGIGHYFRILISH